MLVSGSATLNAPPDAVWKALNDPAVLVRTIPGCQRLETIGKDAYAMTITAGVASIKGVYTGQVRLADQDPPDRFVLKASGAGGPGTVSADVAVTLADAGDGTTTVTYDADAVVGGMIGGVGQRMLTGVAKKTAGEFFSSVDKLINGQLPDVAPPTTADTGDGDGGTSLTPGVYEAPGAPAVLGQGGGSFLQGALVGAGAALLGAVIGGWLTSRRRP